MARKSGVSSVRAWSAGSHAAGRATRQGSWISQQRPLVTLSRALSWSGGWSQTAVEEQVIQRKGNEGQEWRQLSRSLAEKMRSHHWEEAWSQGRDFIKLLKCSVKNL